jgi:hypothetical protein
LLSPTIVATVVERLQPFDIVCVMRERTPMTRTIIERLPKLRVIASTVTRNASIDLKAAEERGVQVVHTGYFSSPTIELTGRLAGLTCHPRSLTVEGARLTFDSNAVCHRLYCSPRRGGGGRDRHLLSRRPPP